MADHELELLSPVAVKVTQVTTSTTVREVEILSAARRPCYSLRDGSEKVAIGIAPKPIERKKHINGVGLPVEQERKQLTNNGNHDRSNIAAIDFGTTSCSLAYCLKGDTTIHMLKLSAEDNRVPSTILVDPSGTVTEFGKNARRKYAQLPSDQQQHYKLFSGVKMNLQHDKVHARI